MAWWICSLGRQEFGGVTLSNGRESWLLGLGDGCEAITDDDGLRRCWHSEVMRVNAM